MNELATTLTDFETFLGVDIGDKHCHLCALDSNAEVIEETRIATKRDAMERFFRLREPMRVVLEVGTHSRWLSELVEAFGHEVIVANPRRLRLIAENHKKSDRTDAELLARLGRFDPELLAPIQHRSKDTSADLAQIRGRAALVRSRTLLINSVRGQVKSAGYRLPSTATPSFHKLKEHIPELLHEALFPLMLAIQNISEQIKALNKTIETCANEKYPETKRLRQIAGVGPITALTFVLVVEDPTRFARSREVGPYVGLTGRKRQSGDDDPQLGITKRGDQYLRRVLVQAAQYILGPFGPDTALRAWGLRLAERGGKAAKRRAVTAVARKLSVLLLSLWKSGEDYQAFPNS